jgi:NADH-quinone oxidoreductase subunit L
MWVPLAVLALLSTVGGLVGIPAAMGGSNPFEHFLEPVIAHVQPAAHGAEASHSVASGESNSATASGAAVVEEHHDTKTELGLAGFSILLAVTGMAIGYLGFKRQPLRHMPKLLENKYYVDELYDASVVEPIEHTSRSFLWKVVDVKLIDGFVNGVAKVFAGLAGVLRYTQTGFARGYAAVILVGAIVVIGYFGYIALR